MTHSIKKLKDSQIELTVELDHDDLVQAIHQTEKRLAEQARVEGFRQGKVPEDVIRQKIGEETIRQESLSQAIESSVTEICQKESIDILDQEKFEIKENTKDKLLFTIILTILPIITLGKYTGLTVERHPIAVASEEVEKILKDIAQSRTILQEAQRPAHMGDQVEVDFKVSDQGTVIEGGQSQNHPLVLGEHKFIEGFEDQIVGMENGQTKNFSLTFPDDYYQTSIAGKNLDFEVTLRKVQERTVPEITDEFVQTLGTFSSRQALEQSIQQGLTMEKEAKENDRLNLELIKKIADTTSVEIPSLLIERQLDSMVRSFDEELHQSGLELSLYLAQIKKTRDELRQEWRAQAELQVKLSLIVKAVARQEHIAVASEEADEQLETVLQQYILRQGQGPEALKNLNTDQLRNRIRDALLHEKVFAFLKEHNILA